MYTYVNMYANVYAFKEMCDLALQIHTYLRGVKAQIKRTDGQMKR